MPSAGLFALAVFVPLLAAFFYSSSSSTGEGVYTVKNLLRMAQGAPKLSVAPYEVAQPVRCL